jgi:hypothetical protein
MLRVDFISFPPGMVCDDAVPVPTNLLLPTVVENGSNPGRVTVLGPCRHGTYAIAHTDYVCPGNVVTAPL